MSAGGKTGGEGGPAPATTPMSVEAIFEDHVGRRLGLLAALTRDFSVLFTEADPASPHPLCLSSTPDGAWRLTPPSPKVPSNFPEPTIGINFARDGMPRGEWGALVALHADAWLRAVASFQGAAASLTAKGRAELFGRMNGLATLAEELQAVGGVGGGGGEAAQPPPPPAAPTVGWRTRPAGRPFTPADVSPALRGVPAALYWPDDDTWYPVTFESVGPRARTARVIYGTGEAETLDLDEVAGEGHMVLL